MEEAYVSYRFLDRCNYLIINGVTGILEYFINLFMKIFCNVIS